MWIFHISPSLDSFVYQSSLWNVGLSLWASEEDLKKNNTHHQKNVSWLNRWSQGKFSHIEIYWIVNSLSREAPDAPSTGYLLKRTVEWVEERPPAGIILCWSLNDRLDSLTILNSFQIFSVFRNFRMRGKATLLTIATPYKNQTKTNPPTESTAQHPFIGAS